MSVAGDQMNRGRMTALAATLRVNTTLTTLGFEGEFGGISGGTVRACARVHAFDGSGLYIPLAKYHKQLYISVTRLLVCM